jgi:cbb3-type cytochrome oxidase subunit 3
MIRDVMEEAGLEFFAEVGLIIFFVVFVLVTVRVLLMRKDRIEHAKNLPLEDDVPETAGDDEDRGDSYTHADPVEA